MLTREQIAVILMNYANSKKIAVSKHANLSSYSDYTSISIWASDALSWAIAEGLLKGKSHCVLDPKSNATRAEVAAIVMRFMETLNK